MRNKTFRSALVAGSLLTIGCSASDSEATRPNVLLIVIDDLGWNDIGALGSSYYETPNIDSLASRGVLFTNNYSGCSVSSPSRASLLTGKSPVCHGITNWIGEVEGEKWNVTHKDISLPASYKHNLDSTEYTLANAMHDEGYATYFIGKWHLGDDVFPTDFGFDVNIGGWAAGNPRGGYFSPYKNPKLKDGKDGENLSMRLSEEANKLISSQREASQPFFMMLCYYAVHGGIETTEERWSKFRDKAEQRGFEDEGFKAGRRLPVRKAQDNPVYAGLVNQMDEAVGEVINHLKETGLDKNTIVIFTSDNGGVVSGDSYSTSLAPLRGGKGNQWEGGTRVPLIIYNPYMQGGVVDTSVIGMDLYPTILDLTSLELHPEQHCDGVSLKPLMEGKKIADRDLHWHYPHYGNQGGEPSSTILDGDWKLIYYHEDQRMELYNIRQDISEQNDLAATETERVESMRKRLDAYLAECDAKMPTEDTKYTPEERKEWREQRYAKTKAYQERLRKQQLQPDWSPNKTWWGSQPED